MPEPRSLSKLLVVCNRADGKGALAPEDLSEMALAGRVEMLGDDDRSGKVLRKGREEQGQGLDPASGRANYHEIG